MNIWLITLITLSSIAGFISGAITAGQYSKRKIIKYIMNAHKIDREIAGKIANRLLVDR